MLAVACPRFVWWQADAGPLRARVRFHGACFALQGCVRGGAGAEQGRWMMRRQPRHRMQCDVLRKPELDEFSFSLAAPVGWRVTPVQHQGHRVQRRISCRICGWTTLDVYSRTLRGLSRLQPSNFWSRLPRLTMTEFNGESLAASAAGRRWEEPPVQIPRQCGSCHVFPLQVFCWVACGLRK